MAKKKDGPGAGPAYGIWRFRPTEFWGGIYLFLYRVLRYFLFLPMALIILWLIVLLIWSNFIDVDKTVPSIQLVYFACALVILGFVEIWVYLATRKPIQKRCKPKKNLDDEFFVEVWFDGENSRKVSGGCLRYSAKFEQNYGTIEVANEDNLEPNQAAGLQNLLPKLFQLQRVTRDNAGLLKVTRGTEPDSWTFFCRRGIVSTITLILALISAFVLFVACFVYGFSGVSFGANGLSDVVKYSSVVVGILSFLYFGFLFRLFILPHLVQVKIEKRILENVKTVDVSWQEIDWFGFHIHQRWSVIGDAERLIEFCELLVNYQSSDVNLRKLTIEQKDLPSAGYRDGLSALNDTKTSAIVEDELGYYVESSVAEPPSLSTPE